MDQFTIEIAQAAIGIECSFGSTREYFRAYLTERKPEYTAVIRTDDLVREQQLLDLEADEEGLRRRVFTNPFLERAAIQRKTAAYLSGLGVLLLHGSTVCVDGKAFLFTAKCGVGKSTHTRLWREVFGDRAVMVNDDRAFLQPQADSIWAYGSPWSGKHGLDSNIRAKLAGICILERGSENVIVPISADEAAPFLNGQVFLPGEECRNALMQTAGVLFRCTKLWRMQCNISPEAARIAFDTMA